MSVKYSAPKGFFLLTPFLFCWIREMASGRKNQKLSLCSMINIVGKSYACISKSCGFIIQAQKSLWNILIAQTFEPVPLPAHILVLLLLAKTGEELFLPSTVHPRGNSSPPCCFGQLQAAQKLQPLFCTSSEAQPIPDVHTTPAACSLSHSSASQKNHICSGSSNIEVTRGCSSMMSPLHSCLNTKKEQTSSFYFFIILPGMVHLWWQWQIHEL